MELSRVSKNIVWNVLGQILLLFLGFLSVKYIFHRLGEDALGIIYFTGTVNILLRATLDLGLSSATVREVSAHFQSEPEYVRELIRTFSLFYWAAYGLISVAIFFLAPVLVGKWINVTTMDPPTATYVLRILGIASCLAFPTSLYASLFRGLQRMEFNNSIDVVVTGLRQFGTIAILVLGGDLFQVVYWFAACYGLGVIVYFGFSSHFFTVQALVPGYSTGVLRRNIRYASRMAVITITNTIYMQFDKVIISKLMPLGAVGYYGVAYNNISKVGMVSGAITRAVFPSFSATFAAGDHEGLLLQYRKSQDLVCFGTAPLFAAVPFAVLPLFTYLLNEHAAHMLLWPATLLSLGFFMYGTTGVPYMFSLAVGKPGIAARLNLYALFVVPPVTVFLIYYFGLVGAAFSSVFHAGFGYAFGIPRMCRQCIGISVWKWYLHVLKVLALVAVSYGVAWMGVRAVGPASILPSAMGYLAGSMVFLTGSYFLMDKELRTTLLRLIRGR